MIINTPSPDLNDVPGAMVARVMVSRAPCGMFYSTEFFDADGGLIRQDQHGVVDEMPALFGAAQPPVGV